ncbi:hypothetical protein GCM10010446_66630 [Streptomyces enissocaesilis]|uniref:Uncharacterized protein n=1 Tax=Streptomyces enissocaesilis TaxID=332589 RepID=A0ABN3XQE5_9ACTN
MAHTLTGRTCQRRGRGSGVNHPRGLNGRRQQTLTGAKLSGLQRQAGDLDTGLGAPSRRLARVGAAMGGSTPLSGARGGRGDRKAVGQASRQQSKSTGTDTAYLAAR